MLSVVVPIYNEGDGISSLCNSILDAVKVMDIEVEIIMVDDGSTDDSLEKLLAIRKSDARFKVVALSRNFGHQAAYTAGLAIAKGDFIAMMDGDLQDPPALIGKMMEELKLQKFDIVFGKRTDRLEGFLKQKMILAFHRLFSKASHINAPANVGNFCVMTRQALDEFLKLQEKNRYLPGLRFFIGFEQGFVEYSRSERANGEAKMSYTNLFKLAFDALFSFSNFPLKFCFYTGIIGVIIFFIAGSISIIHKFIGIASPGWSSTLVSIYFLGSIQLLFLGIIGEYVYRIYVEVQNRPIYIVKKVYE